MRSKSVLKQCLRVNSSILLMAVLMSNYRGIFHPVDPMNVGDTEVFHILPEKMKITPNINQKCNLPLPTYTVKKIEDKNSESMIFYAIPGSFPGLKKVSEEVSERFFVENEIAFIGCKLGWIVNIRVVKSARYCGIATVLTELCMIDPELSVNNEKNKVFEELGMRSWNAGFSDEAIDARKHLKGHCTNLVGLQMTADPADGAFAYLSAATRMKYHYMVVEHASSGIAKKGKRRRGNSAAQEQCSPTIEFYEVADAHRLYDGKTKRIGNSEGSGYQAKWYFCKKGDIVFCKHCVFKWLGL